MSATLRARSVAVLPLTLVGALLATMFSATPAAEAAGHRQHKITEGAGVVRHQKGDPYKYRPMDPVRSTARA